MSDEHWDHDIHGPVFLRATDGSMTIDPDCDMEGVVRDPGVLS